MLPRQLRHLGATLMVLAVASSGAWAQTGQRSALMGTVRDATGGVVTDASVTLTGTGLIGGARSVKSDAEGRYRFQELLPGIYEITVQGSGFQTDSRAALVLPVETTYTIDFKLAVASVAESVNVQARPPLIDPVGSQTATIIDDRMLRDIPTVRSLPGVLNLAPGVTQDVAFGGTKGSNAVSIDGVRLNESRLGDVWMSPNYNWIDQVQVVALGAPAEYGTFTGVVVNGVLRSGSNRYAGLGEFLYTDPSWTANNMADFPSRARRPVPPEVILNWWDLNAQLGGPVQRDHVWFFGGVGNISHDYRHFGFAGPGSTDEDTRRALVKLDYAPARRVAVQGFYEYERANIISAELYQSNPTPESSADYFHRKQAWNVRLAWTPSAATTVEVRSGGATGRFRRDPHPPGTPDGPPPHYDVNTGIVSGNTVRFGYDARTSAVTSASVTRHVARALGSHDVKAGGEYEYAPATNSNATPGGRTYFDSGGVPIEVDVSTRNTITTTSRRWSFFIEDRWAVGSRVTVEPGLRVDVNRGAVPGAGTVFRTSAIGPRIGVTWDVTSAHDTVLRAHYGRYHDPQFANMYQAADLTHLGQVIQYVVTGTGALNEVGRFYGGDGPVTIASSLTQPHVDQWVLALERAIRSNLSLRTNYIRRDFGDFLGYVDLRLADWQAVAVPDPGPDGVAGTADDGGTLTAYLPYSGDQTVVLSNPPGVWRRYQAVQLVARKRYAQRWQMEASYTWSRSTGKAGNDANTNAAYWSLSWGGVGANPNFAAMPNARPSFDFSEAKLVASWNPPWLGGFTIGSIYRWRTGTRWARSIRVGAPVFAAILAEPRGARQTPAIATLDARIEKIFRLKGGARTASVYLDVFNVANTGQATGFNGMSGTSFGLPTAWTDPRTGRVGIRVTF